MNKQNQSILIPSVMTVLFVAMTLAGFYIWKSYKEKPIDLDENTEGSAPNEDDQEKVEEYYDKCPLVELVMVINAGQVKTEDFDVTDLNCDDSTFIEDVTVEIYTADFEEGKKQFRNWLAENGLVESEKLRLEYVER